MKNLALAILCVGLCFYNAYLRVSGKEISETASIMALCAGIGVFIA